MKEKPEFRPKEEIVRELEGRLAGNSWAIQKARGLIYKASLNDRNVLILGDTGTGKEIVANEIHRLWAEPRKIDKDMVTVACPDIFEEQWEAELFGIGKRTASNVDQRKGQFKAADGTTLFLDEIGDISRRLQTKLLRASQFRKFRAVGGKEVSSKFRLICATNQDITPKTKKGDEPFRKDLYHRLAQITIRLYPLAERREDILPTFMHLVQRHHKTIPLSAYRLSSEFLYYLLLRDWPGNVRELENYVENADLPGGAVDSLDFIFDPDRPYIEHRLHVDEQRDATLPYFAAIVSGTIDLVEVARDWGFSSFPDFGELIADSPEETLETLFRQLAPPEKVERFDQAVAAAREKASRQAGTMKNASSVRRTSSSPPGSQERPLALDELATRPATLKEIETLYLIEVVKKQPIKKGTKGESLHALAKKLGVKYDTLNRKIKALEKREPNDG